MTYTRLNNSHMHTIYVDVKDIHNLYSFCQMYTWLLQQVGLQPGVKTQPWGIPIPLPTPVTLWSWIMFLEHHSVGKVQIKWASLNAEILQVKNTVNLLRHCEAISPNLDWLHCYTITINNKIWYSGMIQASSSRKIWFKALCTLRLLLIRKDG